MGTADAPRYPKGTESVLLVEPDAETRVLGAFMLGRLGYRVMEARSAPEAVRLADENGGHIDLLLVEAVMSRFSGRDLAEVLRRRHPNLRTLFLADPRYERMARPVAGRDGLRFLCRPFTMSSLAASVRLALDGGGRRTLAAGFLP